MTTSTTAQPAVTPPVTSASPAVTPVGEPGSRRRAWPLSRLTTTDVSLAAGLPILAYSEWLFGTEVLVLPQVTVVGVTLSLALCVPLFLDTYVVAAMRHGGREVGWALGLVVMSVLGGTIAHLFTLPPQARVAASGVFGLMLAIVIWRVKTIQHTGSPAQAAARAAQQQLHELTAALAAARDDIAARDQQLAEQAGQLQQAGTEAAATAAEHTQTVHGYQVQLARLTARLDAARATGANAENVVPLHRQHADATRPANDGELLTIIRPLVRQGIGRPTIQAEVAAAGLACGSQRLRDLIAHAKIASVAADQVDKGQTDVDDLAVTS